MGRSRGSLNLVPLVGMAVSRAGGREVQRVLVAGRWYVQAYVRCGKSQCSRCVVGAVNFDRDRPGHGPYWYLHVRNPKGHTIRRYVGRDLQGYFAAIAAGSRRAADVSAPNPSFPAVEEAASHGN